MAEKGLNAHEFGERVGVRNATNVPHPQSSDQMNDAFQASKTATAVRMMDRTRLEMEAETEELETRKLSASLERQRLQEEARSRGQGEGNNFVQFLMVQQEKLETQLGHLGDELAETQRQGIENRIQAVTEELQRVRAEQSQRTATPPQDPLDLAVEAIDRVERFKQIFAPEAPEAPATALQGDDPLIRSYGLKLEIDADIRRREVEIEAEIRRESLAFERLKWESEQALRVQQATAMERGWNDTMPRILQLGQDLMEKLRTQPAAAAQAVQPELPPGAAVHECECGFKIVYFEQWPSFGCQNCGAQYRIKPEEAQPAPPAAPTASEATDEAPPAPAPGLDDVELVPWNPPAPQRAGSWWQCAGCGQQKAYLAMWYHRKEHPGSCGQSFPYRIDKPAAVPNEDQDAESNEDEQLELAQVAR